MSLGRHNRDALLAFGVSGMTKETLRVQLEKVDDALTPLVVFQRLKDRMELLHLSEGVCRLMGQSREDVWKFLMRPVRETVHPDDVVRVERALLNGYHHPEQYRQYSYRVMMPGHEAYSWIMAGLVGRRMETGEVILYLNLFDVTAERTENEIRRAEHRHVNLLLEKILSTTQTALFWKDADRRFLGANKAFLDYYEFPSESVIIGKTDEDMGWHEDDDPYRNDELWILKTGNSTYRAHGKCMSHGEMRDIVASKSPIIEDGKIVGLVGSFEDVTEEYRQRAKIEELNARNLEALKKAESANAAKTSFLANVSHDMRTPLNGILGFTTLASESNDFAQVKDYLQKIQASGTLLLNLINDTLELSRIANGKKELKPELVNAAHMFDGLITAMQASAAQQQVCLHVDMQLKELGAVRVDELKLSKVLLNLLSNAVKFTEPGGDVWLIGRCLPEVSGNKHKCRFVVRDTGIGMDETFIPRMFEPFEQEHAASKAGQMGTGLGLSIARQLLDLMGGNIFVTSKKGQGTTFTVELFLEQAAESVDPVIEPVADLAVLDGHRVLLCEDNPLNQEITTAVLEMRRLSVLTASDGQQGIEQFEASEPYAIDAILMDIRMPVLDGLAAAQAIRRLPRSDAHQVPIIALSANAFKEDVTKSQAAGMNAHLTKPVEPKALLQCLAHHIAVYEQVRENTREDS